MRAAVALALVAACAPTRRDGAIQAAIASAPAGAAVVPRWPCMTVAPPPMPTWVVALPGCPDPFACDDLTGPQRYAVEQWQHEVFLWVFLATEECKPPRYWPGGAPPVIYDDGGLWQVDAGAGIDGAP